MWEKSALAKTNWGKQTKPTLFLAFSIITENMRLKKWTSQAKTKIITVDNNKNNAKHRSGDNKKKKIVVTVNEKKKDLKP